MSSRHDLILGQEIKL